MPITIPPLSRRRFLATGLAAGAGLILGPRLFGAEVEVNPRRFAILSDTHIAADPTAKERGTVMAENLKKVVAEVVALAPRPAAVFVNGDCAYHTGEAADYATFLDLIKPIREAGIPIHLTLGNHDHRDRIAAAIAATVAPTGLEKQPVQNRRVSVIKTPMAKWVMIDTLDVTNKAPGVAGKEQLKWLGDMLDADRTDDTAVILMSHHNPDFKPKPGGLVDSQDLLDVIVPRHQVKAHLYGHTHDWTITSRKDDTEGTLHQLNLPPTAYVFGAGKPNGWVDCHLDTENATFELRCLDIKHPNHGQKASMAWRCGC